MAALKQALQNKTVSGLKKEIGSRLTVETVATTLIGGALLLFAYKNRRSSLGKFAGMAGTSLVGKGLRGAGIM